VNKPLEGIKVVELGTHIAVPQSTRMIADWGAEVIKVEPPKGEPWKTIGNSYGLPYTDDNNPIFHSPNANKQSNTIDLKSPDSQAIMTKGKSQLTAPYSPPYQTKEGDWLYFSAPNWTEKSAGILKLLRLEQYIGDPRFATLATCRQNLAGILDLFTKRLPILQPKEAIDGLNAQIPRYCLR